MAIQELNRNINYRPAKKNANAEAPSRYPVLEVELDSSSPESLAIVFATSTSRQPAKGGKTALPTLQREDTQVATILDYYYLEKGYSPLKTSRLARLNQVRKG